MVTRLPISKIMIPTFYLIHLKKQLSSAQFKLIEILLPLIQSEKQVRLERLSRVFPYPITTESRRRKLQRFLDLPHLTGLKQNLSPNKAQTGFISRKYVHIFLQPAHKSIRYSCSKSF